MPANHQVDLARDAELGSLPPFCELLTAFCFVGAGASRHLEFVAALQDARRQHAADHEAILDRSRQALANSRAALRRLADFNSLGAKAVHIAGGGSPTVGKPISDAQWIFYFFAELSAIAPRLTEGKTLQIAVRLNAMARGVVPEHAAAAMAAGLSGSPLH